MKNVLYASKFDVAKVKNMKSMFAGCQKKRTKILKISKNHFYYDAFKKPKQIKIFLLNFFTPLEGFDSDDDYY